MATIKSSVLQAAFDQSYSAIVVTDGSFDDGGPWIVYVNSAFCSMTGYDEDELVGQNPRILQGEETERDVIDSLRRALEAGIFWEGQTVNYRKNGPAYYVRWNISPVKGDSGQIDYFVSVQHDVTAEVEAKRDSALLAGALDAATDAIAVLDGDGRIFLANQTLGQLAGRESDDLVGESLREALDLAANDAVPPQQLRRLQKGESVREVVEVRPTEDTIRYVELRISAVPDSIDSDDDHFVLVGSDVTDRVEAERQLRDEAERDELTGLLNRRAGDALLKERLRNARKTRKRAVAILADIDRFKPVNDTYGHAAGDRVLIAVADAMERTVRSDDAVIRWGGEELLVLVRGGGVQAGGELAERLRLAIADLHDDEVGSVTASFGVATARPHDTPIEWIERADAALYEAKEAGRNRVEIAGDEDAPS